MELLRVEQMPGGSSENGLLLHTKDKKLAFCAFSDVTK